MNVPETRIRITEAAGGKKRYYPEYRGLLRWKAMRDYGWEIGFDMVRDTLEDAQSDIQHFLNKFEVKTEFVKYP